VISQASSLLVALVTAVLFAFEQLFRVVFLHLLPVPLVVVVDDPRQLLVLFVAASDGAWKGLEG
jgi:hypothetical protein